jgi:hypothetical protein
MLFDVRGVYCFGRDGGARLAGITWLSDWLGIDV